MRSSWLPPLRFVVRLGRKGSTVGPFVSGSVIVHLLLVVVVIFFPAMRGRPAPIGDALVVELAGGLPGGPEAVPGASVSPPPPPPPPAEPSDEARVAPEPIPPPAKKKEDKKKEKEKKPKEPEKLPTKSEPRAPSFPAPPGPAPTGTATGAPGASPSGGGVGEGGGIVSLDLGDVEFAWYRASATAALRSHWARPILEEATGPLSTTVAFEVARDGTVKNVRIEVPSGVPALDRSALRAVADASPLPPLPRAWREATLPARFEFQWRP